jgi:hypothetical protein
VGLTVAEAQATLDARFPTTGASDFIAYSANGTTETASLARTAIGATGWAAATAADPSVKANAGVLNTATASAGVVLTHFAVFTESEAGDQRTDWQALTEPRTLAAGEGTSWPAGALAISLT